MCRLSLFPIHLQRLAIVCWSDIELVQLAMDYNQTFSLLIIFLFKIVLSVLTLMIYVCSQCWEGNQSSHHYPGTLARVPDQEGADTEAGKPFLRSWPKSTTKIEQVSSENTGGKKVKSIPCFVFRSVVLFGLGQIA